MVFAKPSAVEGVVRHVRPALDGDGAAQKTILRFFSVYMRFCARKFFLSEEDRNDLLQEGRIALFRAMERYRPDRGPFEPYARLVIRRHINRAAEKFIHRNAVERVRDIQGDLDEIPGLAHTRTPEIEIMEDERIREIAAEVRRSLTHLETDVLAMFLQGLSYRDMARRLKRPAKSVDNALRRIRAKVKV